MHKNVIYIGLLSLVVAFSLWFTTKASLALYHYFALKERVNIEIEKWEVKEIKKDCFTLFATFTYCYKEKIYTGHDRIERLYPNSWAAEKARLKSDPKKGTFWLNPRHPERGKLEKTFPWKQSISALILVGLILYFVILGMYVRKNHARG